MPSIDRDLEDVVTFYEKFDSEVIEPIRLLAEMLDSSADNVEDILYNTPFATKSSEELKEIAAQLFQAVEEDGQKILSLKKRAEDYVERSKRFTR